MSNVVKFNNADQRSVDEVLAWASEQDFSSVVVLGINDQKSSARYSSAKDVMEMVGFLSAIKHDMEIEILKTMDNL